MFKKKGELTTLGTAGKFILIVILVVILLFILSPKVRSFTRELVKHEDTQIIQSCKQDSIGTLTSENDKDDDDLLDICDNCVCTNPKSINGKSVFTCNNKIPELDVDKDNIPLGCDVKAENSNEENIYSRGEFSSDCKERIKLRGDKKRLCDLTK